MVHAVVVGVEPHCGCSSVVEHLLAKERVESSNLFIRLVPLPFGASGPTLGSSGL